MARKRTPNPALDNLLDQARWTRTQLAQQVNRLGPQAGLDLTYDRTAVAHWIAGAQPKSQVRALIVEALSARLGRPVTHAEAGLKPAPSLTEVRHTDTVEELIDLGRATMDPSRRSMLAATVFSAALSVPAFALPARAADEQVTPGKRTVRIGSSQVQSIRTMTERIADILDELGAGHALPMASAFLVNTVGPWLQAQSTESVRKEMLAAASDLTYLTGWMAMYEKAHGLGQRYYVQALGLAREAEDHITYCRTLRGMSLQASNLGYGPKALELADSAAEAAPTAGPRLVAFLRGQQAHSASMVGFRHQAHARLKEAEDALSKADNRRDAIGGYDQTAYLFHVSHVLYEEKDFKGSIRALKQSIRLQPQQERQGRVHSYAVLAQRQLRLGHLDAACESWSRFLDEYEHVSSNRGDDHFHTMSADLRRHPTALPVRELALRARDVAAAKAA
ncbi:tol-pal system YbgF family protein [Streptomyces sp. NPDC058297]|uniref:tetratricopeptide repeat protein n=1 Tax=Streptomyces sp. NPDC058297 TaxID=3346433 RepID=UPI0036E96588